MEGGWYIQHGVQVETEVLFNRFGSMSWKSTMKALFWIQLADKKSSTIILIYQENT